MDKQDFPYVVIRVESLLNDLRLPRVWLFGMNNGKAVISVISFSKVVVTETVNLIINFIIQSRCTEQFDLQSRDNTEFSSEVITRILRSRSIGKAKRLGTNIRVRSILGSVRKVLCCM